MLCWGFFCRCFCFVFCFLADQMQCATSGIFFFLPVYYVPCSSAVRFIHFAFKLCIIENLPNRQRFVALASILLLELQGNRKSTRVLLGLSIVFKTAPAKTKTKTLSRPEHIETKTRSTLYISKINSLLLIIYNILLLFQLF